MPKKRKRGYSLVRRLARDISCLEQLVAQPAPDEVMNERVVGLAEATVRLSQAPAVTLSDLTLKVTALCHRLREHLEPAHEGEVTTALLAESVRDDIARMASAKCRAH